MKTHLLFFVLLFFFGLNTAFGQADICKNIYVWPFAEATGEYSWLAEQFTNCVEEALTQEDCIVLQRSEYAALR